MDWIKARVCCVEESCKSRRAWSHNGTEEDEIAYSNEKHNLTAR